MFCDVSQHFGSFWCKIDAMHYNLITFVVLRCFECFATYLNIIDRFDVKSMQCTIILSLSSFSDKTQKFWSFRRQIDAMHYNLITFVGLRCFECFATYLNILDCFDGIASIWRLNDQNIWVTSLNYKSNQITMDCIDLTSKQSKMLRYVAKHSKQRKTTKVIKL